MTQQPKTVNSPVTWIGGKSRSARRIIARMPEHTCYCEPFAGGSHVFFAKAPSRCEVLNDLDAELVNFYQVLQSRVNLLVKHLAALPHSRLHFRRMLRARIAATRTLDRAVRFWYLQRYCFGGKVRGRTYGYSRTDSCRRHPRLIEADLRAAFERLHRVNIECGPWSDVIARYDSPRPLFYCDPPYWQMPYYAHNFEERDHAALASALRSVRGRFLLSYNDVPAIRNLYWWAHVEVLPVSYAITPQAAGASRGELLISNYDTTEVLRQTRT